MDIKNAINTVSWKLIINRIRKLWVSGYLIKGIENYFTSKEIHIEKGEKMQISSFRTNLVDRSQTISQY